MFWMRCAPDSPSHKHCWHSGLSTFCSYAQGCDAQHQTNLPDRYTGTHKLYVRLPRLPCPSLGLVSDRAELPRCVTFTASQQTAGHVPKQRQRVRMTHTYSHTASYAQAQLRHDPRNLCFLAAAIDGNYFKDVGRRTSSSISTSLRAWIWTSVRAGLRKLAFQTSETPAFALAAKSHHGGSGVGLPSTTSARLGGCAANPSGVVQPHRLLRESSSTIRSWQLKRLAGAIDGQPPGEYHTAGAQAAPKVQETLGLVVSL